MKGARGMTLIEVGIALCVAGMMLAVAVPAMSSITRAQLRQKAGQLSGGIRAMYGAAAIQGRTCRIVFDLDGAMYWSECARGNVRLEAEGERSQNGVRVATRTEEVQAEAGRVNAEAMTDEEREKAVLAAKSLFVENKEIPKTRLGNSVRFTDIWVSHQQEPYVAGRAYLYFWSSGLTEEAAVHLAQGDDVYSLIVSPMTGRVKIVADRVMAPGQKQ
ncbi:MAG TPA: type II secretion system protein [Myxococcales bacterium]|jgi:general secretion pathway protein H